MLPLELLKVIFGALSRDDLDALMLTNALFRDIVLRDFAMEPLRYFAELEIVRQQRYLFVRPWRTMHEYACWDEDDFCRRMRLGHVGKLKFPNNHSHPFDENLLNVLLPVKDAWRDAHVDTPYFFASEYVRERAFSELFFCKSMDVNTEDDGYETNQPFLSFPAVRECTSLEVTEPPSPLTVTEILEWLNADARSMEPKRLDVHHNEFVDSVDKLVQQLKTNFDGAKTARQYSVKITVEGACDGQSDRFINRDTAEVLTVAFTSEDIHESDFPFHYVEMERKPVEEK